MSERRLEAYVGGIGLTGPGLCGWARSAPILAGHTPYVSEPTVLAAPAALPPAERRRTGAPVKLALAAGLEACQHAAADPRELPAVFASSGGDGANCHEICRALASNDRQLSPTRFHNSVHNVAAGYWSIATRSTAASTALCAFDGSFSAGLLEALVQCATQQTPVLLLAYDAPYPEPLNSARPLPDAFAVALVLRPKRGASILAGLRAEPGQGESDRLPDGELERLRASVPAARSLPLLQALAAGRAGRTALEYLDGLSLALEVSPCA